MRNRYPRQNPGPESWGPSRTEFARQTQSREEINHGSLLSGHPLHKEAVTAEAETQIEGDFQRPFHPTSPNLLTRARECGEHGLKVENDTGIRVGGGGETGGARSQKLSRKTATTRLCSRSPAVQPGPARQTSTRSGTGPGRQRSVPRTCPWTPQTRGLKCLGTAPSLGLLLPLEPRPRRR